MRDGPSRPGRPRWLSRDVQAASELASDLAGPRPAEAPNLVCSPCVDTLAFLLASRYALGFLHVAFVCPWWAQGPDWSWCDSPWTDRRRQRMIDEPTSPSADTRTGLRPFMLVLTLLLTLVGFCVYWALPAAGNDEAGLAIAVLALCVFGIASGWKASEPGLFRPFGQSIRFAWKASVAWTTTACFAEYMMTDQTVTATALQFPSWIIAGSLFAMLTFVVAYLVRAVARMGLRNAQVLRDIGQVLGLILAVVALALGLSRVPSGADKDKGEEQPTVFSSPFDRQGS